LDVRRFRADLYELATRACDGDDQEVRSARAKTVIPTKAYIGTHA
jgi:hypothetical protein